VTQLTPRLLSITFGGDALAGFPVPAPTAHIKIFLPAEGQTTMPVPELGPDGVTWPDTEPPPVVRTYTPRRFDQETGTLEVQFVLHGVGPASEWAERAKVGDQVAIGGPGGRFELDPGISRWWIAGDESALPAVAMLLEALPGNATAEVHLEVGESDDEMPMPGPPGTTIEWHQRRAPDAWGVELYEAAASSSFEGDVHAWVACEAAAMRRIRGYLLAERRLSPSALVTRGYWRAGEANHPDHDYGDEAD
jgi:NADPH-dependent ferric siderophore reductase